MINVSSIKKLSPRAVTAISIVTTLIIVFGGAFLSWDDAKQRNQDKEAVLTQLRTNQAKAAEKAKSTRPVAEQHTDVSTIEFKDVSEKDFLKPTCSRLENRSAIVISNSGCAYSLRATDKATMAVVFVYEAAYSTASYNGLTGKDPNNTNSLAHVNKYLQSQAKRYKVAEPPTIDMKFFGPYAVSESVINVYYRNNGQKLLDVYKKTSEDNKVPEQDYDMVHYVLLNDQYGGIAFPGLHRAFTYNVSVVPTFVHETLHLYGASDKYNNNDCNTIGANDPFGRYNGTLPGTDIMCSNFSLDYSMINDITAREIGWAN